MYASLGRTISSRWTKIISLSTGMTILFWGLLTFWFPSIHNPRFNFPSEESAPPRAKHAFATLLTGEGDVEMTVDYPYYFTAVRLLTYQLLHSPRTRGLGETPFVVLATQDVPQEQQDILGQDGAIVIPVAGLHSTWIHPKWERWNDVLAKLHLWRLTEYEKITFLDADSILFRPVDDIFEDPATAIQQVKPAETIGNETVPFPDSYMIAGTHDLWVEQFLPPPPGKEFYVPNNYMNAGFFVLAPSEAMFRYYVSLLETPDCFDPTYPEQNLLNYAHRIDGRMPWKDIGFRWSQKGARAQDYDNGLKSVHHKWWRSLADTFLDEYIANATAELRAFAQSQGRPLPQLGGP